MAILLDLCYVIQVTVSTVHCLGKVVGEIEKR